MPTYIHVYVLILKVPGLSVIKVLSREQGTITYYVGSWVSGGKDWGLGAFHIYAMSILFSLRKNVSTHCYDNQERSC